MNLIKTRDNLCNGQWLTIDWIATLTRTLLIFFVAATLATFGLAKGLRDHRGYPLGNDFISFYSAGALANKGQAAFAYDFVKQHNFESTLVGFTAPLFGWHYPPPVFAVAQMFAVLPYLAALVAYLSMGFAAYFFSMRRLVPKHIEAFWAIAAFSGAWLSVINGQNGFFVAALLALGFSLLEKVPLLAGFVLGLLIFKPQFFFLVPLFLLFRKDWKALVAMTATSASFCALSVFAYGLNIWSSFFVNASLVKFLVLETNLMQWKKMQSVFAMSRLYGGTAATAYLLQGIVAAAALFVAIKFWRKCKTLDLQISALCLATLLITPYSFDYDLILLAIPLTMLAKRVIADGGLPYEKTLLVTAWFWPTIARDACAYGFTLSPFIEAALLYFCYRRAAFNEASVPSTQSS